MSASASDATVSPDERPWPVAPTTLCVARGHECPPPETDEGALARAKSNLQVLLSANLPHMIPPTLKAVAARGGDPSAVLSEALEAAIADRGGKTAKKHNAQDR